MASRLETLYGEMVDPLLVEHLSDQEPIIRRIRGSEARTEQIVGAIVEKDISAGGGTDAGFIVDPKGQRSVRFARVDIPSSYDVHESDKYVIDCEVWEVIGVPVGEDKVRKTVFCKLNRAQTGRRTRTQR
jgi:hypothetical protein